MPFSATYASLDDWIAREAVPFSIDSPGTLEAAVDALIALLDPSVELLGLGEALHFGEDILVFRNRLFQYLVKAHGFRGMAVESGFTRGRLVDDYVGGFGANSYEALLDAGFTHGFGRLEANQELVEWMRAYNGDPSHHVKLRFNGFDSPTEMMHTDSPGHTLRFVLDYLDAMGNSRATSSGQERRRRIEELLGQDADWENPAAMMDPTQSIGSSPAATALHMETETLITELAIRRPELAGSNKSRYQEAVQHAIVARWLLNYHATLACASSDRTAKLLGMRDALMADNLAYIASCETGRGKTLVFAHNTHLQRSVAQWQLGAELLEWWPVGAHLNVTFGPRYAVIGSAIGVSEAHGIGQPEPGTLEAMLTAAPGPVRMVRTGRGKGLPANEIEALMKRSGSGKNFSYFPLTGDSIADFDWLVAWDSIK